MMQVIIIIIIGFVANTEVEAAYCVGHRVGWYTSRLGFSLHGGCDVDQNNNQRMTPSAASSASLSGGGSPRSSVCKNDLDVQSETTTPNLCSLEISGSLAIMQDSTSLTTTPSAPLACTSLCNHRDPPIFAGIGDDGVTKAMNGYE